MIRLVELGTILGSRNLGEKIRLQAEELIQQEDCVVIDCSDVKMMSHSFADELFGKLFLIIGPDGFRQRVQIKNVSPDIAPILRFVFRNRSMFTQAAAPVID